MVKTSSLSSFRRARQVALELKRWVETGRMEMALPTRRIDAGKLVRPMRETARVPRVQDIMDRTVPSVSDGEEIQEAAKKLLKGDTNHLVVLDREGKLVGIVTTYDVSKAIARPGRAKHVRDIMTRKVITTNPDEHVDIVARKLEQYNVSALPVVDPESRVLGMLTAIDLGKLFGGRWLK
jgi:predicted transcriptional regulator